MTQGLFIPPSPFSCRRPAERRPKNAPSWGFPGRCRIVLVGFAFFFPVCLVYPQSASCLSLACHFFFFFRYPQTWRMIRSNKRQTPEFPADLRQASGHDPTWIGYCTYWGVPFSAMERRATLPQVPVPGPFSARHKAPESTAKVLHSPRPQDGRESRVALTPSW
ncbi:hypothetical protein EDB80DRAFT_329938 [Ilyonectria destructans]|nr:hypothetical protein EDB80DRAFT_329938 [Ilyonectria destructans]